MRFDHAIEIAASRGGGQDRAAVFTAADGSLVIALADGAGGTGGGTAAAQAVIDAVGAAVLNDRVGDWEELLAALDREPSRLGHGQTTAVVLRLDASGIVGTSVGDSGAWLIDDKLRVVDLAASQRRKPLLGSGAIVTPFAAGPIDSSTLLIASDGLLKYASPSDVAFIATQRDLREAASSLLARVRLPSGDLQDDAAIVLVRHIT
jgi:serine/threonine protein phosphatase PrpC